jgi:hypothetical protein
MNFAVEQNPLLSGFWPQLCGWAADDAARAVRGLRLAVEDQFDESPGPVFTARLLELDALVLALLRSSAVDLILGGIRTLEALVQVADGRTSSTAINRYAAVGVIAVHVLQSLTLCMLVGALQKQRWRPGAALAVQH